MRLSQERVQKNAKLWHGFSLFSFYPGVGVRISMRGAHPEFIFCFLFVVHMKYVKDWQELTKKMIDLIHLDS